MYRAPVEEITFTLKSVVGMKDALDKGTFGDLSDDLVDAILDEAAKFANEAIAPLNTVGDQSRLKLENAVLTMPAGFGDTYKAWCEAGWNGLTGDADFGGQGLPILMQVATGEMWNSANLAFSLCPLLTAGAIESLSAHGSDDLKAIYLEKLISGEWTGTMNLTEPQSGSDLSTLRSRAEPQGDGSYRIFGQKIYITYGEHNMTDNICHLVLARLPDAPAGVKGISLFLVPKFIPDADGKPGTRNDVFCNGIEHKIGIHASPTCTMIFGDNHDVNETGAAGAIGWLIGQENDGLACMFTMMNNARLNVGVQGAGIGERAYQKALAYANERKQGASPLHKDGGMAPIVLHPDVTRNLMTMRSMVQASRALCFACAHALDMAHYASDETRAFWQARGDLLTPLAKSYSTDSAVEVASIGIQVHGGMGFVEETGAAQYMRDARILPIYEGTNGIQGIDLVGRKLRVDKGAAAKALIKEMRVIADDVRASNQPDFGAIAMRLSASLDDLDATTDYMLDCLANGKSANALAGATPYQKLFALTAGLAFHAKGALLSAVSGERSAAGTLRIKTARFFAENIATETTALRASVLDGSDGVLAATQELLSA
ncbi:MAG: acyl-CoA dehydrogenase [Rhizobiales bacterium]|nr:acyl-CoA dehydrogenase [Hyphomicrobiales bacterium]